MKKWFSGLLLSAACLTCPAQTGTGFDIAVNISDLKDSTLYLAYHFGERQYLRDTLILDNRGRGEFKGDKALDQGIYMIVLPGRKYFEILVGNDQQFSVTCKFNDYINTLKFSGSDVNTNFLIYQKRWVEMQRQSSMISRRIQNNSQNGDSVRILEGMQKDFEQKMKDYLKRVYNENQGNLLAALVKSMMPIEIPEFSIPSSVQNRDSVRAVLAYNYNKDHFFDNIDLTDERMLRTPILQARLDAYFNYVLVRQPPDSINKEIEKLIKKCEGNHKVFQFIAVYLFNHFRESEIMGQDAILVKIADDIYLSGKADWVSTKFLDDLRRQIELLRHNLIGMKAENLVMNSYKGIYVSLYDIEKEFTILYFWEPDCGHCQEETPKLKTYYDEAKDDGVEVFAVCTTADSSDWKKYIEDHKLTWINGWDPERISHFDYYYDVEATPMVYILDRNKKIIAKKLSVEDVPGFISNYRKYFGSGG